MKFLRLNFLYQFKPLCFKQQPWLIMTMIVISIVFRRTLESFWFYLWLNFFLQAIAMIDIYMLFRRTHATHGPASSKNKGNKFVAVTMWRSYNCGSSNLNQQIRLYLIWTVWSKFIGWNWKHWKTVGKCDSNKT
jgi:hypothetical protein